MEGGEGGISGAEEIKGEDLGRCRCEDGVKGSLECCFDRLLSLCAISGSVCANVRVLMLACVVFFPCCCDSYL